MILSVECARLQQFSLLAILGLAIVGCKAKTTSMIGAAEEVVSARLGGGDGITFPGGPIETNDAICGEVDSQSGTRTFVAQIDVGNDGVKSIGKVDIVRRSEMASIAAIWNSRCGGQINIAAAPATVVAASGAHLSQALPATSTVRDPFVGKYEAALDGVTGDLNITRNTGNYHISLDGASADCVAHVDGIAKQLDAKRLRLLTTDKNDPSGTICSVTLTLNDSRIFIKDDHCEFFHGASCGFTGSARRKQ